MKVLTPKEAFERKKNEVPLKVIECWNDVVVKNLSKGSKISSKFNLEELKTYMEEKLSMNREEIQANGWFDLEDHFRKNGWSVNFDKPGYNEIYKAFFVLTEK
jgi:hypothetical protein